MVRSGRCRFAVVSFLAFQGGACTLVGTGMGLQLRTPTTKVETVGGAQAASRSPGLSVVLRLKDGNRLEGVVESVGWRVGQVYEAAYADAQTRRGPIPGLPDLGPVTIHGDGLGRPRVVELVGVEP